MMPETTQTGVPVTDCTQCGDRHPVTRTHCTTCGRAHLFQRDAACTRAKEVK